MRRVLLSLLYCSFCFGQVAPNYTIDSIAGSDPFAEGGPAAQAALEDVRSVATDSQGNVYFSDSARNRVLRISAAGILHVVAGNGTAGFGGDGSQANAALLNQPYGLATDSSGNLYIADLGNGRVRRIGADGRITTIAGGGTVRLTAPTAIATEVMLKAPRNVATDSAGNVYVADFLDHRVLRVSPNGQIQVLAGTGVSGPSTDSVPATQGTLSYPAGLYADATGLYIADSGNHAIRKVNSGVMTTLRFQDTAGFLNLPTGICGDSSGNLYIASSGFGQVLRVSRQGAVTAVAQGAKDVAVDAGGTLYLAAGLYVRKLDATGTISTIAGVGGQFRGEGAAASQALLNTPSDVKVNASGAIYIADTKNNRIRRITGGMITTIAGDGVAGFQGDRGPALAARLSGPQSVAVDRAGNVYVADTENHRVRRITPDGQIATVAGTGVAGSNGDVKLGVEAQLNAPGGVAVDSLGQVHIADTGNHKVRRLLASGYLVTMAGNGQRGFAGDGSNSWVTQLDTPRGLAFDIEGHLYIADSGNRRIRKLSVNGVMSTIAGSGGTSSGADGGKAIEGGLVNPIGVAVDDSGNVLVTDAGAQLVTMIARDGRIQTIAGSGVCGYSGDAGPALEAKLNEPGGIAVGADGTIYVADRQNHRIRSLVRGAAAPPPVVEHPPDIKVLHAATLEAAPLAPGMLVSVQGRGVGPANAQSGQTGAGGVLESTLAGTEVRFDGRPAPILYAQQNLINAQVPYRLWGQPLVLVEVVRDGSVQGSAVMEMAASSPGIFTSSGGTGQITAVNDDYTLNGPASGAARGSLVTFYATGEGLTEPATVDGKLSDAPYPTPKAAVEVTIGGQAAEIVSMGSGVTSPGVLQLTVRIPMQAASGGQGVVLKVGGVASQRNATIVVK